MRLLLRDIGGLGAGPHVPVSTSLYPVNYNFRTTLYFYDFIHHLECMVEVLVALLNKPQEQKYFMYESSTVPTGTMGEFCK